MGRSYGFARKAAEKRERRGMQRRKVDCINCEIMIK